MFFKNEIYRIIGIGVLCFGFALTTTAQSSNNTSTKTTDTKQTYQPIDVSNTKAEQGEAIAPQPRDANSTTKKYQPIDISNTKAELGETSTAKKPTPSSKKYQPVDVSKLRKEDEARIKREVQKEEN